MDAQRHDRLAACRTLSFTVFKTANRVRLTKLYSQAPDGTIQTTSGTQFYAGSFRVMEIDATDLPAALREIGQVLDGLGFDEAIAIGVPMDGAKKGTMTTKERFKQGDTDAIPRALSHFDFPVFGLLPLDGDNIDGLPDILCEYPPFEDVALLCRPSASASIADRGTGAPLKRGQHVYCAIDNPALSKDCLEAILRLGWSRGQGWMMLASNGSMLVRGVVDVAVGSAERLLYEGEAAVGKGITRLPRVSAVVGGTGVLCARDLIAYAEREAPLAAFEAAVAKAKQEPGLVAESERRKAAFWATHITRAVARLVAKGVAPEQAEREVTERLDAALARSATTADRRILIELTADHTLFWPDGGEFTVGDILKDPGAFHKRECADPFEGLNYPSKNCAIIYAQPPRLLIYSHAHGGAFRYVADMPWPDYSQTPLGEALRALKAANENQPSTFFDQPRGLPPGELMQTSAEFVASFVPPDYLIDGLLQRRYVYSFTSPTGGGKTSIALLLAMHVAFGLPLAGREVERGRVLFFAGENPDDVRTRWIKLCEEMRQDPDVVDVVFMPLTLDLSDEKIRARIDAEAAVHGPFAPLIVDTSAAYFAGDDENDNVKLGAHARMLRTFVALPGGPAVLVTCHPTKNPDMTNLLPRGGGAFLAEVDGNLVCIKDATTMTVEVTTHGKFRGPDFAPFAFELVVGQSANLTDSRGRKIWTIFARSITTTEQEQIEQAGHAGLDQLLRAMLAQPGRSLPALATQLHWLTMKGEPSKQRVQRAMQKLQKAKLVVLQRDRYFLTPKGEKEAEKLASEA